VKPSTKISWIASLIGTGIGLWAWWQGVGRVLWPAHPQLAGFLITVAATLAVQWFWPGSWPKGASETNGRR